VSRAER